MSVTDYSELSKNGPEKSLLRSLNKKAGRNSYGRITVRHRGGGRAARARIRISPQRAGARPACAAARRGSCIPFRD